MSSKDNKVNKVKTFKKEFIFTAIALIAVGAMFVILPKSSMLRQDCFVFGVLLNCLCTLVQKDNNKPLPLFL
jgi:hypothetical protein